ncbi:MAG: hypothetical protein FGM33_06330 [Candidatus Kapabacteria bacterium]|nr:hypothetical protein [Candidatus Kapabacteria bacterium]
MMWAHMMTARGFVRRRPWSLLARVIVIALLAVFCASVVTVLFEIERDISRTAESIVVDVVLPDSLAQSDLDDLMLSLRRRPDVGKYELMTPERVWAEFQSEIGVSSSGLSEIAAMPHILRVNLKADFVTTQHARDFAASVRRRHQGAVDDVILPMNAVVDVERRRSDLMSVTWIARAVLAALCLLFVLISTGRLDAARRVKLSAVLGPAPAWFGTGPMLAMMLADLVGGLIAVGAVFFIAPSVKLMYSWIHPERALMLSGLTIAIVVAASMLVRLVQNLWPLKMSRG